MYFFNLSDRNYADNNKILQEYTRWNSGQKSRQLQIMKSALWWIWHKFSFICFLNLMMIHDFSEKDLCEVFATLDFIYNFWHSLSSFNSTIVALVWASFANDYHTRAIISRGLYIFTSFFIAVYNQERSKLQTIYALNKEILQ